MAARDDGQDASHRPHRLHTTLTPARSWSLSSCAKALALDDLLAVTREFLNPDVSRSGLDRCLRRHGVSNLQALTPQPEDDDHPKKTFKDDEPGFVHVDIISAADADEDAHRYLFVGIDRASRWVYVETGEKTAANAAAFFSDPSLKRPSGCKKV